MIQREVRHIAYGPLAEFCIAPDVVLLFAHAQQSLIFSEAVSRVEKEFLRRWAGPLAPLYPRCSITVTRR